MELEPSFGVDLLFCTEEEEVELFNTFEALPRQSQLKISGVVRAALSKLTGGHIGLLVRSLEFLEEQFSQKGTPTEEVVLSVLNSSNFHAALKSSRGMRNMSGLTTEESDLLKPFLFHSPQDHIPAYHSLIKKGILCPIQKSYESKVVFANPLVRRVALIDLCVSSKRGIKAPETLEQFVIECLRNISPSFLRNTLGKTSSVAKGVTSP